MVEKVLSSINKDPILEFTVPVPKIGVGKSKNQLATNNNASVWMRYYKSKIKNTFKDSLGEWSIPLNTQEPYELGSVVFTIYRPNKRRIDADSISGSCGKWTVDFIVEQLWFKDDNTIQFIYKPAIVEDYRVETEVLVQVYDYHIV